MHRISRLKSTSIGRNFSRKAPIARPGPSRHEQLDASGIGDGPRPFLNCSRTFTPTKQNRVDLPILRTKTERAARTDRRQPARRGGGGGGFFRRVGFCVDNSKRGSAGEGFVFPFLVFPFL